MATVYATGAGDANYNGAYVTTGATHDGAPVYQLDSGHILSYDAADGYWVIGAALATSGSPTGYYHLSSDPSAPPLGAYLASGPTPPAPTLSATAPVASGDFTLSPATQSATLAVGGGRNLNPDVFVNANTGSSGNVTLSLVGVPAGLTATLSASQVAMGGSAGLNLTNNSLAPGTYTFQIQGTGNGFTHSVDVTVTSPAAGAVPATMPAPALAAGDGQLTASWLAPASTGSVISSYTLSYRTSPNGALTSVSFPPATSRVIAGLTNGTAYDVRIFATNSTGDGAASPYATGTPAAPAAGPVNPPAPISATIVAGGIMVSGD